MTDQLPPLILGSGSPRRCELLGRLGLDFEVATPQVDESPLAGEPPPLHTLRVARLKAKAVAERHPGHPVLAADTIVALGEAAFGKPRDRSDAARMLGELAGKVHTVLTALVLHLDGREACHLEAARVTMTPFRRQLVAWYVATGEGDDKAGAYAVQGKGAVLVERVDGNVETVIGLPLAPIPVLFTALGLDLVQSGDRLVLSRRDVLPHRVPRD